MDTERQLAAIKTMELAYRKRLVKNAFREGVLKGVHRSSVDDLDMAMLWNSSQAKKELEEDDTTLQF